MEDQSEPVVTFDDIRGARYCIPSVRAFCAEFNIDIRRFREGVPVSVLIATGHHFAVKLAKAVEARDGWRR